MGYTVDIDDGGMPPRLEADDSSRLVPADIGSEGQAIADRLALAQRSRWRFQEADFLVQSAQGGVAECG